MCSLTLEVIHRKKWEQESRERARARARAREERRRTGKDMNITAEKKSSTNNTTLTVGYVYTRTQHITIHNQWHPGLSSIWLQPLCVLLLGRILHAAPHSGFVIYKPLNALQLSTPVARLTHPQPHPFADSNSLLTTALAPHTTLRWTHSKDKHVALKALRRARRGIR